MLVSSRRVANVEGWRWAIACVPWGRGEGGLSYVGQSPVVISLEGYSASLFMLISQKLSKSRSFFMLKISEMRTSLVA